MSWRLHLTNQAIQALDILSPHDPSQTAALAAWSRPDRVVFYELETGTPLGERILVFPLAESRQSEQWTSLLGSLTAPNGAFLPFVQAGNLRIYTTDDGRMHLYHDGGTQLFLENDGTEVPLPVEGIDALRALALDRFLGLIAALDDQGRMHVYQQHIPVGTFDLGLLPQADLRPSIAISRGGGAIFVTDGRSLVLTDSSGRVRKRLGTHYFVGDMACSPDGRYVATSDLDTGVLRIYTGSDLGPLYQRFAIDLIAAATQVQLIADLPPSMAAMSALCVHDDGTIAFAVSGVICVSTIEAMDSLPRPQTLL